MIFKNKPSPTKGDTRIVEKFAIIPEIVRKSSNDEKYTIWFEKYYIDQEYSPAYGWVTIKKWIS